MKAGQEEWDKWKRKAVPKTEIRGRMERKRVIALEVPKLKVFP